MMSTRKSTRLASKSKQQDVDADLLFEESDGRQFNLKRTPRTPYQRVSQKRKRAPVSDPEAGVCAEANGGGSPVYPLTQNQFQNNYGAGAVATNGKNVEKNDGMLEDSFDNDSFLRAVDLVENAQKINDEPADPPDIPADDFANCSQDMFGAEDAELFETSPKKPKNEVEPSDTPKRNVSNSNAFKKPSLFESESDYGKNEFRSAKEVLEKSTELSNPITTKPKNSRKRTPGAGDKKKKRTGGGQAGPAKKKKGKFKIAFTNRKGIRELANSAGNELSTEDLSYMTNEEKLMISSWGLPVTVVKNYEKKKITSLFPWQLECLENEKVMSGRNLLYSAPTSAGKTLVAEILMLKRVLELGRKAIMILPFVSVAREKVYSLQSIFGDAGVRVEGFMGSINPPGGFKAVDIAVCTIEKANSLINKLLEEGSLSDLGTLVVDELHLIGDPHRGYLLELLLTKILYMTVIKNCNGESQSMNMTDACSGSSWKQKRYHIQIVGMSATLPNLDLLAKWLKAELYVTDFRPVPLKERLKLEDKLVDEALEPVRDVIIEENKIKIEGDSDNIVYLALETVMQGYSILIFCPTKALVEATAEKIRLNFIKIGTPGSSLYPAEIGERLRNNLNGNEIKKVLDQLKQCPGGVDEVLARTVMFGVGYHHAGLTYENRDIVESSFKKGILKVIVATSTLSAGVNLPARRVMIVTPLFNRAVLDTLTYRQMCGRAGRNGIDTEGESILICPAGLKDKAVPLFRGEMNPVKSALLGDGSLTSSMKRALLEAIASGIASLVTDVRSYAKCTFLFHSLDSGLYGSEELTSSQLHKDSTIEECVDFLKREDFIRIMNYEAEDKPDEYFPTQLGSACLASSLSPDDGIIVYGELLKARECFVLENELHVIYQVTPIYVSDTLRYISWHEYLKIFDHLNVSEKKVAELIGISEGFIMRAMVGTVSWNNPTQRATMAKHQRFFAALALSDLVNEKSLEEVSNKFTLNKGTLQNLQQTASTFAGMVTAFCGRLGWSNLELLLSQFQERLEFGVQRELCDLVRLDCLNGQRARHLYDAGIKTVMELAGTDPAQIEQILHKAAPFKSDIHGGRESNIWMIGKEILSESEAAQKIVFDARSFIQIELGQQGNVQFAFGGGNKLPETLPQQSQKSNTSSSSKVISFVGENNSEKESEPEEEALAVTNNENQNSESAMDNFKKPCSNYSRIRPACNLVQQVDGSTSKQTQSENMEEQNVDMGEIFTQGNLELEQYTEGPNLNTAMKNIEDENDMFEDSFPEIVSTNISVLYGIPNDNIEEDNRASPQPFSCKFSIAEHVENCRVLLDASNNGKRVEPNLMCSTPVVSSKNKARFTLKSDEYTSPVPTVESSIHTRKKEIGRGHEGREILSKNESAQEALEPLERSSAVFDDSLAEVFENSFNFQTEQVESSNKINQNTKNEVSLKLSETDHAALKAIAENSRFESEELFPSDDEVNVEQQRGEAMEVEVVDHRPNSSVSAAHSSTTFPVPTNLIISSKIDSKYEENLNGIGIEDWENEDFIATQAPVPPAASEENDMEIEDEMFQESSSDTDYESSDTFSSTCSTQEPIIIQEAVIGGAKITAKTVQNVSLIPDEFFSSSELIGVGLKLEQQIKSSGSIARQGIGARILGRKASHTSLNGSESLRQHSISLYNGKDTIWTLRWDVDIGMPVTGKSGSGTKRLEALLYRLKDSKCMMTLFDCKDKLKMLLKQCGFSIFESLPKNEKLLDPKVAQWMWDFDDEDLNITKKRLIEKYVTNQQTDTPPPGWKKETIEAYHVWIVMTELRMQLEINGLWSHYLKTEMPCIIPLLFMEMNGFGLDATELTKLKRILQYNKNILELRAYQLAGRQFSLNSPKDIKQVLYKDIGLKQPKSKGTGKDVLSKLDHELPQIIIEWRKINNTLNKYVIPFQQERNLETSRVHGNYTHFTCTGRVPMSEPSLQSIPKDFDIRMVSYTRKEIEDIRKICKIKYGSKFNAIIQQIDVELADNFVIENSTLISMRNVFTSCSKEFTLLTADYSQLELRILAHLCKDEELMKALNSDMDVFTEIASQWRNIPKDQVTYSIRQEAKAIVYGVIYGMGPNTLAEKMEIEVREADSFMRQFMKAYPGVQTFKSECEQLCLNKGYVKTMSGRRRYLPLIRSRLQHEIEKAKRQAINSRIQGSAADLVKCAMTRIHSFLTKEYPKSALPVEWTKLAKAKRSSFSVQKGANSSVSSQLKNLVFFPILNLHDELIFEVRKSHLPEIAKRIKHEMETSLPLLVKIPVVLKTGDTWGNLETYQIT